MAMVFYMCEWSGLIGPRPRLLFIPLNQAAVGAIFLGYKFVSVVFVVTLALVSSKRATQ
jgi:hypothetical protein